MAGFYKEDVRIADRVNGRMIVKKRRNEKAYTARSHRDQPNLLDAIDDRSTRSSNGCQVVSVGKRRDGGTRYWCLVHRANATAKYGQAARVCRASHIPLIRPDEILLLDVDKHKGGTALWGAVPPIYDTTRHALDRGIHVQARRTAPGHKTIDGTFRAVRVIGGQLPKPGFVISELDAIYYMVSSIFGYEMKYIECEHCGCPHLDKDWFSVHPHRRHLCAGCGRNFRDADTAIGNPICHIRDLWKGVVRKPKPANRKLDLRQADYLGGIQIWGSNPVIIWTSQQVEEEGIHVHAFNRDDGKPILDDTFSQVTIDGISLDAAMVRTLMAQSALPHIEKRVVAISCPKCGEPKFSVGEDAFTPAVKQYCTRCGNDFRSVNRFRKIIGNPLVGVLERLSSYAVRLPQKHLIGLLPETL